MSQVAAKVSRSIRASLSSSLSPSKPPGFTLVKSWIKGWEPRQLNCPAAFDFKSVVRRILDTGSLRSRGGKVGLGSALGVSLVVGAATLRPNVTFSSDDDDKLIHVERGDIVGASDEDESRKVLLVSAGKLWLPILFGLVVLLNLEHPMQLILKVILFLLSTKPSRLSVYLFIEQMRSGSLLQEQHISGLKSLYANKVEVEDYTFLCLARVEMGDQKLSLIGILGSWWKLPLSPGDYAFIVPK